MLAGAEGAKVKLISTVMMLWVSVQVIADQPAVVRPETMQADMVVSGRTSTAKAIAVERVDLAIPETFSGDRLKNAAGFSWFVSRHYALQTDYDDGRAKHLLTLLELAFPHYAECFGAQIQGDKRMAVIYGASRESLSRALAADGIAWDFNGGGITYEGIRAAFNYPSGTLQYHQRYIMLHECAHQYQMCLNGTLANTPGWYFEGVADAVAHHVWNETEQRLTMCVVDKPTINNWYEVGLDAYAREKFSASDILNGKRGGREYGFLLFNYFATDLDRWMKFGIWRDELVRLNNPGAIAQNSGRLIEQLFGTTKLEADFDALLRQRKSSFHYVDWGWEQDGDALLSYGWPQKKEFSQTDLRFAPGDTPGDDPLVMDYPLEVPKGLGAEIAAKVMRGGEEPVIGYVVSFAGNPDAGLVGMGLGVRETSHVRVMVNRRKSLVVDATDIGAGMVSKDFGGPFGEATAQTFEVGVLIRLGREALEVTAQGGEGNGATTVSVKVPLTLEQRDRLMREPVAVLARGGRHRFSVFLDEGRRPEVMDVEAPANRWRYEHEEELYRVERAIWRLGSDSPLSLLNLRERLVKGESNVKTYEAVVRGIESSNADAEKVRLALIELLGSSRK